ncbi:MAG: hypothetical protein J6S25_00805 [Aeriscardovia sp.]|nr:hypothetical protein [Aeriscardovia sp.]
MYKNEYDEQDIKLLLRNVKVIKTSPPPKPGNDLGDFGAPGIGHLALAISENYVEATKEYNDPYSKNHYKLQSLESMKDKGGSKLEYDHIIPLQEVWNRAVYRWPETKKAKYVHDPIVGVITSSRINDNKHAKGLVEFLNSKWLNGNKVFNGDKRSFCLSWLVIAVKYDIPLTPDEKNEIDNELKNGSFPVKVINPIKPW